MKFKRVVIFSVFFYFSLFSQDNLLIKNQDLIKESLSDFSEGVAQLLTDKTQISAGANKVIYSAAQIAALTVQETNLSQEELNYLQLSVAEFEQGLIHLLENKNKSAIKSGNHTALLKEGLNDLFYYMFSLVVLRNDIKIHLKNIFISLLKIITAVISDKGFNEKELQSIQASLHSALESKVYCHTCLKSNNVTQM
jgi:hypothetical protein